MRLLEELQNYSKKDVTPLHMPGHKRKGKGLPYNIDITEIDDFDNLQNPNGILKECLDKADKVYRSFKTFYSVNGGTCGVLTALATYCDIGDKVIVATNCHKSVYNFIELFNLHAIYMSPKTNDWGIAKSFLVDDLRDIVNQNLDAKAVILTSPTYEGVLSNIKEISTFLHSKKIPLIVDEAHGSHLILEGKSAINFGADIVLNSCHKTLSGLTQTALIHIGNDALNKEVVARKLQDKLNKFQSSSPSYVLMASIDECVEFLIRHGKREIKRLQKNLKNFKKRSENLKYIKIFNFNQPFECFDFDNSKIVISASPYLTGSQIMDELRKLGFELEMSYNNYCLAMMTIFDNDSIFEKFMNALFKIDRKIEKNNKKAVKKDAFLINFTKKSSKIAKNQKKDESLGKDRSKNEEISFYFKGAKDDFKNVKANENFDRERKFVLTIHDAKMENGMAFNFSRAVGKVSQEYIYAYPPGSPILVPGEIVTEDFIEFMRILMKNGTVLHSTSKNHAKGKIMCLTKDF